MVMPNKTMQANARLMRTTIDDFFCGIFIMTHGNCGIKLSSFVAHKLRLCNTFTYQSHKSETKNDALCFVRFFLQSDKTQIFALYRRECCDFLLIAL